MKPPALRTRVVSNQHSLVGWPQGKALVSKNHWFPKTDIEAILSTGILRNYFPKKKYIVSKNMPQSQKHALLIHAFDGSRGLRPWHAPPILVQPPANLILHLFAFEPMFQKRST